MNLYKSKLYYEDMVSVVKTFEVFQKYDGKAVLITGAGGLICSAVVDLLLMNNKLRHANTQIYVAGRNEEKLRSRFCERYDSPNFHYVRYDASKKNQFDFHADYIIHGASNAYPEAIQKHPVETMLSNFWGTYELLEYAKATQSKRLLFISSSEVYGEKQNVEPFVENEYGTVDLLNPRSSYASSKRTAETLCASYNYENEIETVIIRPGHIYGPTASKLDNRVSSVFAYQVIEGKDLVLKSDGSQIRSYCYMFDAATAILMAMVYGKSGEAYNISNPNSVMTIRQMAQLYADYGEVKLKFDLPTELERAAFNPMSNSSLNSDKLQELGWRGLFDHQSGIEHTIAVLRQAL